LGWNGTSDLVSLPQSSLVIDQGSRYRWTTGGTDLRYLQSPDGSSRRATTMFHSTQLRLHLAFPAAYSGTLHLYALDWEHAGRRETITVNDGSGPRVANLTTDFSQGVWVNVPISVGTGGGSVTITVDRTAGSNAVLSGLFLGGASGPPPPSNLVATAVSSSQINLGWTGAGASSYKVERSPDGSTGWTQIATPTSPSYSDVGLTPATTYYYRVRGTNASGDSAPSSVVSTTTGSVVVASQSPQGNWVGTYGAIGSALFAWNGATDLTALPAGASLGVDQGSRYQWTANGGTDVRDLQSPDGSSRRAACLYHASQIRLHLTFTGAFIGSLHLYALDWEHAGRREAITVNDGSGPRTATLSSDFSQGAWVDLPISVPGGGGSVTITVDRIAGTNAVLSGLFLGDRSVPPPPTNVVATAVTSSRINLSWTGTGASSYKVERSPDGSTGWTQIATPTSPSYSDTGLTPSTTYYYRIRATSAGGDSAPSSVVSTATGDVVAYGPSPQGNWVGKYGTTGYALLGWNGSSDLVSLPSSATLVVDQGSRYQWTTSGTDVRYLQSPDATSRRATCLYNASQIRLHLSFTGAYIGSLHIYALDWEHAGRREAITINDGSGPRTATITTDFTQGAWIDLPISVPGGGGSVTISVDRTAGTNAVLSGLFLD
jgi:hypothetical protein